MSASNEWTEWHLTPRGWESGSRKTDFVGDSDVPEPPDRVLTFAYSEFMSSAFSKLERNSEKIWESPNSTLVSSLLKKYGKCPQNISVEIRNSSPENLSKPV